MWTSSLLPAPAEERPSNIHCWWCCGQIWTGLWKNEHLHPEARATQEGRDEESVASGLLPCWELKTETVALSAWLLLSLNSGWWLWPSSLGLATFWGQHTSGGQDQRQQMWTVGSFLCTLANPPLFSIQAIKKYDQSSNILSSEAKMLKEGWWGLCNLGRIPRSRQKHLEDQRWPVPGLGSPLFCSSSTKSELFSLPVTATL